MVAMIVRGKAMFRSVLGLCLALALSACEEELLSGLGESEANEIVAVLLDAGLAAQKRKGTDGVTVLVDEAHFSEAVRLLKAQGLPRETFDTLADVFSGDGIVSSPVEEQARLIHALGQELSQTVSSIDGVLAARVHVVLPTDDERVGQALPSSASVFIRHEKSTDLSPFVPQIKTLVANSVAGLNYDRVSVALFPAKERPPAQLSTPTVGGGSLSGSAVSTMTAALGLGLLGGGMWLALRQRVSGLAARRPAGSGLGLREAVAAPPVTYEQAGAERTTEDDMSVPGSESRDRRVA